jgi:hypothetical protein
MLSTPLDFFLSRDLQKQVEGLVKSRMMVS